jgi:rsbT antagonist protein RsbS
VAGIKPAVAITLVEMGLRLDGARTARSLEAAMAMLGSSVAPVPFAVPVASAESGP